MRIKLGATCTISNDALSPAAGIARPPFVVICGAFSMAGAPMAAAYLATSVAAGGNEAAATPAVGCCAPAVTAVSVARTAVKRTAVVRIIDFSGEIGM